MTRYTSFTLLSFGATPSIEASLLNLKTLHVVDRPADPNDVADTAGHLAAVYGAAADRTLVLIRPDGYLALISDAGDVSAVTDYLAAIR